MSVSGQAALTLCQLSAQSGSSLGFRAAEIAKLVAPLLRSPNPHVVDAASQGMAKLGPSAAPFALRCIQADSKLERHAAVCILEGLGPSGVQGASTMLRHQSPEVRRAAMRLLQRVGKVSLSLPDAVERIGAGLEDPSSRVRGVAALALANLGSEAAGLFKSQLLETLRGGAEEKVEAAELRDVLEALTRLGPQARWAAEAVADLLQVAAWSVRRSAAMAYGQICGSCPSCEMQVDANAEANTDSEGTEMEVGAVTVQAAAARLAKLLEEGCSP